MNKYKEVNIKHTCSQFPRLFGHTSTIVRAYPKIGRNELCPCKSGKKYKKCCLRNENSKNT